MCFFCGVALSGCGPQATEAKVTKPALIINDLQLSPAELKQELASGSVPAHELAASPGEEPEWISRLIERELLVQEAQRFGLDRELDFMRTIERFWKEALIKLLIRRKAQEIAAQVHVYEPEIEAYYTQLSHEAHARILSFADEPSATRVAQAQDWEETLAAMDPALLDDSGWQWYTSGMLDPELETRLFDTQPGQRSTPIALRGRWIVVAVDERREQLLEPLATLREEIRRTIRQQKQAQAMERWIAELKGRARIVMDREAIAQLQ